MAARRSSVWLFLSGCPFLSVLDGDDFYLLCLFRLFLLFLLPGSELSFQISFFSLRPFFCSDYFEAGVVFGEGLEYCVIDVLPFQLQFVEGRGLLLVLV
jgi:hypothetical protein